MAGYSQDRAENGTSGPALAYWGYYKAVPSLIIALYAYSSRTVTALAQIGLEKAVSSIMHVHITCCATREPCQNPNYHALTTALVYISKYHTVRQTKSPKRSRR